MKEQKIKKEMLISEIIEKYPDIIPLIMGYGLHCVGCHFSGMDNLEAGAKIHGMSDEDIKMMVKDSNELLKELEEN